GGALPALRGGGPGPLRGVARGARAAAARRGGPSGTALALGEVSLAGALAGADLSPHRVRRRDRAGPGFWRRHGQGGGVGRLSRGARAPAVRERDGYARRGGRTA